MNTEKKTPSETISALVPFITKTFKRLGTKTVEMALLLYYAYKRKETPKWAKRTILASLAYLISPIDLLPDIAPLVGFTDDVGVLSLALGTVAFYINDEVREQTAVKLSDWNLNQIIE